MIKASNGLFSLLFSLHYMVPKMYLYVPLASILKSSIGYTCSKAVEQFFYVLFYMGVIFCPKRRT
jgi:hypothetical protein